MLYMSRDWSLLECSLTFGDLDTHVWSKWMDCGRDAAALFLSLDEECRSALVHRAMQCCGKEARS